MSDEPSLRTALCEALEIEYPIVQAPIGSAMTSKPGAAVSNAGGLGPLAIIWRSLEAVSRVADRRRRSSER